jgi:citronellol/citronellal dehydrogenase
VPSKIFQAGLLDGQVALVTGGGSGLGRATALELAALGASVVICGRRQEPLDETVAMSEDGRVEAQACDIREEDQVDALVDTVMENQGRIDLLVNNAGGQYLSPAEDITPKGFRTVIRLNVEGTWLMTHAVATRAMIPGGRDGNPRGGKIVNVTLSPHHGLPGMAHSSAARAAVENLTRVLSIEWARFGIRLTAIAPGPMATETMRTKYPQAVVDSAAWTVPVGRLGTEEEFAWLVAYLASPAGDYLSGTVLTLDGARDNWFGAWPPAGITGEGGKPLAEERRPKP